MKTVVIIIIVLLTFSSCNNKQVKKVNKVNSVNTKAIDSSYFCLEDSITVSFLSKASYKKAIATCRLTLLDQQFILKGHGYMDATQILENYYSREEHERNNIPIRIAKWGSKDEENIIYVWYKKENNGWLPIVAEKYHKSAQF
ncbi:hypothetical protein [Olleya sp. Bg11-27]|uniref:hypothetical protein n=1 Tax=Olleya sp. Bg11-27 TaxID=2058135 RepID=UPI000C318322|nr:hypothetical protein [Olleya sp. Bg11-27]AUC76952.1 hypothetical protein CW732_15215 [Olleya sp. Bg11-27]